MKSTFKITKGTRQKIWKSSAVVRFFRTNVVRARGWAWAAQITRMKEGGKPWVVSKLAGQQHEAFGSLGVSDDFPFRTKAEAVAFAQAWLEEKLNG